MSGPRLWGAEVIKVGQAKVQYGLCGLALWLREERAVCGGCDGMGEGEQQSYAEATSDALRCAWCERLRSFL